jgi:hypothetical protein
MREVPLHGGFTNTGRVHRVGDTVRRPLRPTSPATHEERIRSALVAPGGVRR